MAVDSDEDRVFRKHKLQDGSQDVFPVYTQIDYHLGISVSHLQTKLVIMSLLCAREQVLYTYSIHLILGMNL